MLEKIEDDAPLRGKTGKNKKFRTVTPLSMNNSKFN